MEIKTIAKALVPSVMGGILLMLSFIGIAPEMTVKEALAIAIGALATSVGVWATPNQKA